MIKKYPLFILITLLLFVSLACGKFSLRNILATDTPEPTATEKVIPSDTPEPTATLVATATEAAPVAQEPTTASPATTTEGIAIEKTFFYQESTSLVYAFYVMNADTSYAYSNSEYNVVVYDASDTILQTTFGYVNYIRSQERLGVANTLYLEENQTASRVEISLIPGDTVADTSTSPFVVSTINYLPDEYYPMITCSIENTSLKDITELYVSALAFDANGNFVGGGYTYQYFLFSESSSGVSIYSTDSGAPATIEVYPTLSGFSEFLDPPTGTAPLIVQEMGGAFEETRVNLTFFIQNTVTDKAIENNKYQVTIYDAEGKVIGVSMGYLGLIYPAAYTPLSVDVYLGTGTVPDNYTIQVLTGDYVDAPYPSMPFSVTDATYVNDEWYPYSTGTLVNTLAEPVSGLMVVTVAYNANGEIIGGGYAYPDTLPANGTLPVEVYVLAMETPAKIEMYPMYTTFTTVGE